MGSTGFWLEAWYWRSHFILVIITTIIIIIIVIVIIIRYNNSPLTLNAARKIIDSTIKQHQTCKPTTPLKLVEMLDPNILYKNIYLGFAKTKDEKETISCFLGLENLHDILKTAEEITIEGHFRVFNNFVFYPYK